MKTVLLWVGGFVGVIAAIFLIMILAGVFTVGGAKIKAEVDQAAAPSRVQSRVFRPENVISNYDYFFNTCRAVIAFNQQIKNTSAQLLVLQQSYNPATDRYGQGQDQINRLRIVLIGLQNQRDTVAQEYNAAAAANTTRGRFRDASLPVSIDPPYTDLVCP